jgi:hypothetical protein
VPLVFFAMRKMFAMSRKTSDTTANFADSRYLGRIPIFETEFRWWISSSSRTQRFVAVEELFLQ